jgi:hypothetical protein
VAADEPETVRILAVGQKKDNTLFIAGKEIDAFGFADYVNSSYSC